MKKFGKKQQFEAEFFKVLERNIAVDHCLLCGKKMTSACHSHTVPQFILRNIDENGKVCYGYKFQTVEVTGYESTTGIKNAHLFRLICDDCDKHFFKDYENPQNLLNFDNLDLNTQKIMLCQMSVKAHLSHIFMKFRRMVARDMASGGELGRLEREGKHVFVERPEIEEHEFYIKKLRQAMKSNKNPFEILYSKTFDYKMKLATQTTINYHFDLKGNIAYPKDWIFQDYCFNYFYLMILPLKKTTRVFFYTEKSHAMYVKNIIDQFNELNEEEKLHFLFISLLTNEQDFFMTPSFAENIVKKDKKIVKYYTKTEWWTHLQSEIKDFRKYNNYLDRKYSDE